MYALMDQLVTDVQVMGIFATQVGNQIQVSPSHLSQMSPLHRSELITAVAAQITFRQLEQI